MRYQVIVAEDELLILQNTVQKIHKLDLGFQVAASAQTGVQALEKIEEFNPSLLITDIRMPVMDGLELIERAKETHPDLDCIILSGYADFEYAQRACRLHAFDYLLKPVEISALRDALERLRVRYAAERRELDAVFSGAGEGNSPQFAAGLLREYLNAHYREDVKINLIAESLNYSSGHLSRVFQQCYDVPPNKYLITLRIRRACQLLASDDEPTASAVGAMVGYPEPGYFARIFKKYMGISPQQYRNEKRGPEAE